MGKEVSKLWSIREGEQEINRIFTEPLKVKIMNAAMQGKMGQLAVMLKGATDGDSQEEGRWQHRLLLHMQICSCRIDLVTWQLVRRNKTCQGNQLSLNQMSIPRTKGE